MSSQDAQVIDLPAKALEPVALSGEEREMLHDLAAFASEKDRIFRSRTEGPLPGVRKIPEQVFYVAGFEGTFSLAEAADGSVFRCMTMASDEGLPSPGVFATVADELGYTGTRRADASILPGRDWKLALGGIEQGERPFLTVMQKVRGPLKN